MQIYNFHPELKILDTYNKVGWQHIFQITFRRGDNLYQDTNKCSQCGGEESYYMNIRLKPFHSLEEENKTSCSDKSDFKRDNYFLMGPVSFELPIIDSNQVAHY